MVNTYNLVNPYIKGDLKTSIKANNSIEAAKKLYAGLSEHFNNNIPKFYFSVQKGKSGNGKLYHFEVSEQKNGEEVDFAIKPYSIPNSTKNETEFKSRLLSFKSKTDNIVGGKSKKSKAKKIMRKRNMDNDSDDIFEDDSDDFYRMARSYVPVINQPIHYFWYDPLVFKLDSVFIPTFYSYITPFVEIVATRKN
jgi:hypothetical protein